MSDPTPRSIEVPTYEPERCPLSAALRAVGGKWRGLIWWRLQLGLVRFNELQRSIPQLSRKVLTDELRAMEEQGLVARRVFADGARVEYSLTELGESLGPVFDALARWGEAHAETDG